MAIDIVFVGLENRHQLVERQAWISFISSFSIDLFVIVSDVVDRLEYSLAVVGQRHATAHHHPFCRVEELVDRHVGIARHAAFGERRHKVARNPAPCTFTPTPITVAVLNMQLMPAFEWSPMNSPQCISPVRINLCVR